MMTCTECGYQFLVVAHTCSLDPLRATYCAQCFPTTGCERDHPEGCAGTAHTRSFAGRGVDDAAGERVWRRDNPAVRRGSVL
jgi:hypothetical protein